MAWLKKKADGIERTCYECKQPITLDEALEGIKMLHNTDMEGWVHCEGADSEFVQASDREILSQFPDDEGSILVHPNCIRKVYAEEKGEPLI